MFFHKYLWKCGSTTAGLCKLTSELLIGARGESSAGISVSEGQVAIFIRKPVSGVPQAPFRQVRVCKFRDCEIKQ